MHNLKFKSVKAQGILCFGEKGIALSFENHGNVVLIKGINLDNPGTIDSPASNGAGKSSVQELLSIGLFGKTVKSPTKLKNKAIINTLSDKGTVEVQWDDFRVMRTFKKSATGNVTTKLQAWESPEGVWDKTTEKTQGKPADTQRWIESKIGITHHVFCNVVIFDDSNTYSFLEAVAADKRQIVENLLGLDQYRQYHENAKQLLKNQKQTLTTISDAYVKLQEEVTSCDKRKNNILQEEIQWKQSKQIEIKNLLEKIKIKQSLLLETDSGEKLAEWQKQQDAAVEKQAENITLSEKIEKMRTMTVACSAKIEEYQAVKSQINNVIGDKNNRIKQLKFELDQNLKLIKQLTLLDEGSKCPVCHGEIQKANYQSVIDHAQEIIKSRTSSIQQENSELELEQNKLNQKNAAINEIKAKTTEIEGKIQLFTKTLNANQQQIFTWKNAVKPDSSTKEQLLEAEIEELKKQFESKKEEYAKLSPFTEILKQSDIEKINKEQEVLAKGVELENAEKEIDYIKFWVEAFGDGGIRKYVVDGIIPVLNSRISHWLQHLIDGKIELSFDNTFEENILRSGNPLDYDSTSKGEKRRINLAISQAFAYVMMINSGSCPSVVFLDEITGGSIDQAGISGIYNMIFELAKERQVFVTTHDKHLLEMLQGCESITLRKKDDFTELLQN